MRADNTSGGLGATPGRSLAVWARRVGRSLITSTMCLHCFVLWTKKRKWKEIQSMTVGTEWILSSDSEESEYKLHLSVGLTETRGLATGPNCTWRKKNLQIFEALTLKGHSDLFLYNILEAAEAGNSYLSCHVE